MTVTPKMKMIAYIWTISSIVYLRPLGTMESLSGSCKLKNPYHIRFIRFDETARRSYPFAAAVMLLAPRIYERGDDGKLRRGLFAEHISSFISVR